jgi:hypothetical protein
MRTAFLTALLLCTGCAAGLERDARCLAALTPDFLEAHTELTRLRALGTALPSHIVRREHGDGEVRVDEASLRASQAELRLAHARYHLTIDWYDRIYQRVQTRLEERQMLTEAFWTLAIGPGLLFYPIVHWNVHTVIWDGADPDAESDPIRRFCSALAVRHERSDRSTEP